MASRIENLTEVQKNGVLVLRVKGKLDSILSPALEKHIFASLSEKKNKLLLDLSEVTYINSAGLRMLLSIKKQMKSLEGTFMVCCLRSEVLEMMKICGFDHVLDISQTEEEALRRF